jgi:hypothetical protein
VVLGRHAEQLADDHDRRVRKSVTIHAAVAAAFDLVEPSSTISLDAHPQPLDHLRRERLAHESRSAQIRRSMNSMTTLFNRSDSWRLSRRIGLGEAEQVGVLLIVLRCGSVRSPRPAWRLTRYTPNGSGAPARVAQQTEELVRVVAKLGCECDAQEVECLLGRLCHQCPHRAGAVCVTVCPGCAGST